jgi:hypothetical protein
MRRLVSLALATGLSQLGHAAEPSPSAASAQTNVTPISITKIGKNTFMVRDPLTMTFNDGAPAITVPAGFVTELASVPKRLHWWNGSTAASIMPAVFHDYLYWTQACTQDEADAVMYHAMAAEGAGGTKDAAIYRAVSGSGSAVFKNNRERQRDGEVRTFTAEHVALVVRSPVDANETLASALRKAQSTSGLVKRDSPSAAVKLTCARLLQQCKPCRDHVAKKEKKRR